MSAERYGEVHGNPHLHNENGQAAVVLSSLQTFSPEKVCDCSYKNKSSVNFDESLQFKQCLNKYGSVQELHSTFSHTKSVISDFSLV